MKLAEVLKSYRWATHKTVRELAKEIGCSAATLNRFEDNRGELSGEVLAKILTWLLSREA